MRDDRAMYAVATLLVVAVVTIAFSHRRGGVVMRRRRSVAAVLAAGVLVVGCSSDPSDESPGLDRIDGPARVDPSFDPFETVPVTDGG